MTAEEQDEQIRGFEERLRDLESRFCWEQERNRMLEERVTQLEMLLKKRKEYPVINHYLMQYAYKGKEEKLMDLFTELERYRKQDEEQRVNYYEFDLEHFSKARIMAIWKEIEYCLDMKQKTLVDYIMENTNLGTKYQTIRRYLWVKG